MIYGSVCSGIEAATVAWHPLGWKPSFFSEIEKFPRAVLAHHYPDVPLHGDFTTIEDKQYDAIDLLCGGTPCQSFSIAGLRKGLDDDRGNLALEYLRLAQRLRPKWVVWENVPGVLSSNRGRDFGAILGGLAELGYGWAYRILDAQFFGVPQRRRRVFLVGYLGDWRRAAAVLFERHSLQGNSPPLREARKDVAPTISARTRGGGGLGTDFDLDGGLVAFAENQRCEVRQLSVAGALGSICRGDAKNETLLTFGGNNTSGPIDVATALNACNTASGRMDFESETFVAVIQECAVCENPNAGPDGAGFRTDDLAYTLEARTVPQAIVFDCKASAGFQAVTENGVTPTLRSMSHANSHQNAGGQLAVAFDLRGRDGGSVPEGCHDTANILASSGGTSRSYLAQPSAVRRLTPRECERLQGFPDDYTLIPWRGKPATECPDGPRYRALGNSMAVPVMRWIGERIQAVDDLTAHHGAEAAA